jgi:hypothetical protein
MTMEERQRARVIDAAVAQAEWVRQQEAVEAVARDEGDVLVAVNELREQVALAELPALMEQVRAALASPDQRQRLPSPAPEGSIDTAIRAAIRTVMREEARGALADHRAEQQEREGARLVPLAEAAKRAGLTMKALRSRCERGSIDGATKIGGRWHLPLSAVQAAKIR